MKLRLNEDISAKEVRLIDQGGKQIGIISRDEALKRAVDAKLDLVEIVPNAKPPVCKIIDYGKYLFQLGKKQAIAKKKQKRVQIKKIRIRPTIEEGDYQVKLRSIIRFIQDGDKVEVSLRFKGREFAHKELGVNLLKRLLSDLDEYADVEKESLAIDKQMMLVFIPKKIKT